MACESCRARIARGVTTTMLDQWTEYISEPPRCAFDEDGDFTTDNWNCDSIGALRELEHGWVRYNEDQAIKVLAATDGRFVVLGWYKNRGRTELAIVLDGEGQRPLHLDDLGVVK